MKQVLLDTSFIVSSVKNKLDFLDEIESMGFGLLIPKQVIGELEGIVRSKQKKHNRDDAQLALKLLGKISFKEIDLGTKKVDFGIKNFAEKNPGVIVATLDRELQNRIKNNKLVIRRKNQLEIR